MRLGFFVIFIACSIVSFGQSHTIFGVFPTYNANVKLNSKWTTSVYSFLSINPVNQTTKDIEYLSQMNAFYIELDAIYNLTKEISLAGSYTYERANPFLENYRNENRIWFQAQHLKKFEKFNLKNRLRSDLRFIENRVDNVTDFQHRLRYLLGLDFPLNDKSLYFAVYNEFFFDTFEKRVATYSENWAFAGLGFNLSEKTKLETGLLNISWIRNSNKDWLHQYYWQLTVIQNFNLKK